MAAAPQVRYGQTVTTLSLRHSEMAVLLALRPEGYTANELAVALSERGALGGHHPGRADPAAGRAGADRAPVPPVRDLHPARRRCPRGPRPSSTGATYAGPSPATAARSCRCPRRPAIAQLRDDLHQALRSRLIAAGDADALLAFADTAHGHDDYEIWQAAYAALPATSPRRTEVESHLQMLDAALA